MSDESDAFQREVQENIDLLEKASDLKRQSIDWMRNTAAAKYTYNFSWLGRPIIQFPQDVLALQELIWAIKPGTIIETGIAHGGSLIFYASMLKLLGNQGKVVGVDIDIRAHNRAAIESHPFANEIVLIEGSSVDPGTFKKVCDNVDDTSPVLVVLDSNHTHDHVLSELRMYSPLVKSGSYVVVLDTVIEDMPADMFPNRSWGPGNNPKSAVKAFLKENDRFKPDTKLESKLLITTALHGYLRCTRNP